MEESEPRIDLPQVNALIDELSALLESVLGTICQAAQTGRPFSAVALEELERLLPVRERLVACSDEQTACDLFATFAEALRCRWEVRIERHERLQKLALRRRARRRTSGPRIDRRVPMPGYCSASEAAQIIGVSKSRVYTYLERGTLPAYRLGKLWLITEEDARQYRRTPVGRQRTVALPPEHDPDEGLY